MESKLLIAMNQLGDKFRYEVTHIDPLHTDIKCDTNFLKKYIKAYDYYKTYMALPEDHVYKSHYLCWLVDALAEMGVYL